MGIARRRLCKAGCGSDQARLFDEPPGAHVDREIRQIESVRGVALGVTNLQDGGNTPRRLGPRVRGSEGQETLRRGRLAYGGVSDRLLDVERALEIECSRAELCA